MFVLGRIRKRLNYANAVGALALFLAIGGGSALALAGSNTVRSDDIVNGQVHKADLAGDAVRSSKVKDGSLKPRDAKTVVASARGGPLNTNDVPAGVNLPLTGATWTQPKGEMELIAGSAVVKRPGTCTTDFAHSGAVQLDISGDAGKIVGTGSGAPAEVAPGGTLKIRLASVPELLDAPLAAKNHTLTLKIKDFCLGAGQNWTVQSVRLDMVGLR